MNRIVTAVLLSCGTLAMSAGAFAQDYGRDRSYYQDRNYQDRDRGFGDRMRGEYRGAFYDRLQGDLARAERGGYLRGEDFRRFDRAHREIGEFEAKWSRGMFDRHEMDEAIASVQRVVQIRALRPGDRDALREDLDMMRRFRSRMQGNRY